MIVTLFWASFISVAYVYVLYPIFIYLFSIIYNKRVKKSNVDPSVTIIIAAYNEAKFIKATIENKLNLDYPSEKLEIIVVSDGSEDGTDEIVKKINNPRVRLIRQDPRRGKTSGLNLAVPLAKGDVIVFSDANSLYSTNAIAELVKNFSDESVGYVTGKMVYVNQDGTMVGDGCSAYMKYENLLRKNETLVGSIVGVDGGIDAIRAKLYSPMRSDQLPDFTLPLKIIDRGYRVVYDPSAILNEHSLNSSNDEYRMRVRVTLRALHSIKDMKHLLNPAKYGIFTWQLISHKILRYCAFIMLFALYISNIFIIKISSFYLFFFILQSVLYAFALIGYILEKRDTNFKLFYIPFYFCILNIASAHAFWKFIHNEKQIVWSPRRG